MNPVSKIKNISTEFEIESVQNKKRISITAKF